MITHKTNRPFLFMVAIIYCTAFFSCKDNIDLPSQPIDSYTKVYMSQVVSGPVVATLKIKDIVQTATYGAIYGGQGFPNADVPVSFSVDNAAVSKYNTANSTSYEMLPSTSYTLSATDAVIPKGKTSTSPLVITFKTTGVGAMEAMKTYILPITVSCPSVKINEALKTTYYIVKAQPDFADYTNFDRSTLSIIGFSSEEANGEGPSNGKVKFAFDGNKDTFWHSQWQGASPGPPHNVTIDLGSQKTLHGVQIQSRQDDGSGKPNDVNVRVSTDNVNWIDAGSFNLQNNKNPQSVFLPGGFKNARFVKITINSSYGATYLSIAEINLF